MQEISYRLVFGFSTPMLEILFAALIFKFGGEYGNRTHRQLRAKQPRTPAQSFPEFGRRTGTRTQATRVKVWCTNQLYDPPTVLFIKLVLLTGVEPVLPP